MNDALDRLNFDIENIMMAFFIILDIALFILGFYIFYVDNDLANSIGFIGPAFILLFFLTIGRRIM